jgi:hypothetical protein
LTGIAHGIMAFANPLVLVGAVMIGTVIGVLITMMGVISELLGKMNFDWGPLTEFFEALIPPIKSAASAIMSVLGPAFVYIGEAISNFLVRIAENSGGLTGLLDVIMTGVQGILEWLQPLLKEFISQIPPFVEQVVGLIDILGGVATKILDVIGGAITDVKDLVLGVIEGVVGGIERFAALDGSNLKSVGAGMLAISGGLAAFGVGGALAGVGGAIGEFFGGDPIEKFKRFGEIAEPLEKAGMGAFALGQGIKALASVNLNKLGKQIGPFVDAIKNPLQELSEIEFSTAQANVITELLATLGAEGKDALASAKAQAGAVVNQQVNNNMAQSTTSPVFPRTKTIDSPPEMWASRADF